VLQQREHTVRSAGRWGTERDKRGYGQVNARPICDKIRAEQSSVVQRAQDSPLCCKLGAKTDEEGRRTTGHETFEIRFHELYENRGVQS
jgi:hypothetical protein